MLLIIFGVKLESGKEAGFDVIFHLSPLHLSNQQACTLYSKLVA
jgi:hypothetical protein